MYLDKYLKERNTKYAFLFILFYPPRLFFFFNHGILVFGFYFQSLFLLLSNGFGLQQGLVGMTIGTVRRSGDSGDVQLNA